MLKIPRPVLLMPSNGKYIIEFDAPIDTAVCHANTTLHGGSLASSGILSVLNDGAWEWGGLRDDIYKTRKAVITVPEPVHYLHGLCTVSQSDRDALTRLYGTLRNGDGSLQYYGPLFDPIFTATPIIKEAAEFMEMIDMVEYSRTHDMWKFHSERMRYYRAVCTPTKSDIVDMENVLKSFTSIRFDGGSEPSLWGKFIGWFSKSTLSNDNEVARSEVEIWDEVFTWYDKYYTYDKVDHPSEPWHSLDALVEAHKNQLDLAIDGRFIDPSKVSTMHREKILKILKVIDVDKTNAQEAILIMFDLLSHNKLHTVESVRKYKQLYEAFVGPLSSAPKEVQDILDETQPLNVDRKRNAAVCRPPVVGSVNGNNLNFRIIELYLKFMLPIETTNHHFYRHLYDGTICFWERYEIANFKKMIDGYRYEYVLKNSYDKKKYGKLEKQSEVLSELSLTNHKLLRESRHNNMLVVKLPTNVHESDIRSIAVSCDNGAVVNITNFRPSVDNSVYDADIFTDDGVTSIKI